MSAPKLALFFILVLTTACGGESPRDTDDGAAGDDAVAAEDEASAEDTSHDADDAPPFDDAAEDVAIDVPADVPADVGDDVSGDVSSDVPVDAADVPGDAAADVPLDGACDPALETRSPGGMCDGRGIIACNMWAQENGGPDAAAVCLRVPGGGCARATACGDASAPATCRCGTLPACAPGEACITTGGIPACVCAGLVGP
jgi:hypothetical protein